ncbi:hypothetical protein ACQCT5_04535 [Sutcliffiella halmapala]
MSEIEIKLKNEKSLYVKVELEEGQTLKEYIEELSGQFEYKFVRIEECLLNTEEVAYIKPLNGMPKGLLAEGAKLDPKIAEMHKGSQTILEYLNVDTVNIPKVNKQNFS